VVIVSSHERRRVTHFNITEHPTAAWAAQQMIEAFPEDQTPRYLVRDRDGTLVDCRLLLLRLVLDPGAVYVPRVSGAGERGDASADWCNRS